MLEGRRGRSLVVYPLQLLVGEVAPVQEVVLGDEQDVEQDGEEPQTELGWISEDGAPVVVVIADEEHLDDGERSTGEVEDNVSDAPTHSALTSVVHVRLGHILDESYPQLDVGTEVEEREPRQLRQQGADQAGAKEQEYQDQDTDTEAGYTLVPSLVEEALEYGDHTGSDCMNGKEYIIGLHRVHTLRMLHKVIVLYGRDPEERNVEDSVDGEPDYVQAQEVKVQPDHAFPFKVFINLWIEGD